MIEPLFTATERFDPMDGEKWQGYFEWAKIPALKEIVGLDSSLCPSFPNEIIDEDWNHIMTEDFCLRYFYHLDYLLKRVESIERRNILGLYRNPKSHITKVPADGNFKFCGYELIEEQTHISALTNCGGFPDVFRSGELNSLGLISEFERAQEVGKLLAEKHPKEPHAQCELYAIWRLEE